MLPMQFRFLPHYLKALYRFRDYEPQPVCFRSISRWLRHFEARDRSLVLRLLDSVQYVSKEDAKELLVGLNQTLLRRLKGAGIRESHVIYVHVHDPGSSSSGILSLLRDSALLEQRGCKFIDSTNVRRLNDTMNELETGAIIYVDDFAGTGNQFCKVRDFLADYIVGTFPEFFLLVAICEEALYGLEKRGVEAIGPVHSKVERPLHPNSTLLDARIKDRLTQICYQITKRGGLGYRDLATMIIIYRNAPNTVPVILRGNTKQRFPGIFPRTTDLPVPD